MGFEPARSATIRVDPDSRVTHAEQRRAYLDEVLRRVGQAPGIEHAAITDSLPLRAQPHLGRRGQGRDLRARHVPAGVRAGGQRRLSGGDGRAVPGRSRPHGERQGRRRAGDAGQQDAWPTRCGRAGPDWPVHRSGRAPRNAASSASSATCGICRSSSRPATRCTCRRASATTWPAPYLVVRSTLPPAQVARDAARRARARSRPTWPATTSARCSRSSIGRCRRAASRCFCSAASPCSRWSWRRSASTR